MSPAAAAIRRPVPRLKPDIRGLRSYLLNGLASTTNIITNGGFETNTTGWITTGPAFYISAGATFVRDATTAVFGSASGLLTVVATQFQGCSYTFTAEAGQTYTASFYIKGTATALRVLLGEADGGTSTPLSPVPSATFTRYQLTWACLADTAAVLNFRTNDAAGSCAVNIDGVQIEKGSNATVYVETDGGVATKRPTTRLYLAQDLSASTSFADEVGGDPGTGGTSVTPQYPGKFANAVRYIGVSGYGYTLAAGVSRDLSALTTVFMLRRESATIAFNVWNEQTAAAASKWDITVASATGTVTATATPVDGDTTNTLALAGACPQGQWVLLACDVDIANDTMSIYRNGVLATKAAKTFTATTFVSADAAAAPTDGASNANARYVRGPMAHFSRLLTQGEHMEIARRCGF